MENINNDIIKLTKLLENTENEDSGSSDEELFLQSIKPEDTDNCYLAESITNDEDTIFILETCTDPCIKTALICNIKKRNILNELIKNLEANLIKVKNMQRENYIKTLNTAKRSGKMIIKKRLGSPYFKDSDFFPSPPNDDFISMKRNKHLSILDCVKKENWSSLHKYDLVKAVYEYVCKKTCTEVYAEMSALEDLKSKDKDVLRRIIELQKKLKILNNSVLIESVAKQWQNLTINNDGYFFIKNKIIEKSDDSHLIIALINNSEMTSAHWQQISDKYFDSKFTPMECEAMWSCYLHPKFCKEPWKEGDDIQLQELAVKWNYENWEAIAEELDNQKSAYQCCVHFYSKLYDKFVRTKWTTEEEQLLKGLVEESRIGDYINWTKIAHYFKGRTKSQIYSHYYQAMLPSITKGSFTIEEDVLLLTLLKLHNNDMKKVKLYFSARSLAQLRDRFKTMSRDDSQVWTLKDDCRIIDHVQQHGEKKWYLLVDLNRSNSCIRHRYHTLKKWFDQNPNDDLQDVQRRYKTGYRRKLKLRYDVLNSAVQKLLQVVKTHTSDDKQILNLSYIHKNVLNMIPLYKSLKKTKHNTSYYKNKSKIIKQKSLDSKGTLHHYCINFFQPTFKKITRGKLHVSNDEIVAKAKRVMSILKLLGAKLNLPTRKDAIDKNMMLTSSDKDILHAMIKLQLTGQETRPANIQLQYLIPPTPETLIGFRGLMLHSTTLRAHSRGNYEGYHYYVYMEQRFQKHGITFIKRRNDIFLSNLDANEKQVVINERTLFWKRLKSIFNWPCIMQDTKIEPTTTVCETTPTPAAPPPQDKNALASPASRKRGRPTRQDKSWKIKLMNKARLEKQKQALNDSIVSDSEINLPINASIDSINLPSTSKGDMHTTTNSENSTYEITKNTDNSIHIQLKSFISSTVSSSVDADISATTTTTTTISSDSESEGELDENIKTLMAASRIDHSQNNVINQMSNAIKEVLAKRTVQSDKDDENVPQTTIDSNIKTNKRKTKIIIIPSKKIKLKNTNS